MGPYELNEPSHYHPIEWVALVTLVGLAVGHTRAMYWEGYLRYIQIPKVKNPCFCQVDQFIIRHQRNHFVSWVSLIFGQSRISGQTWDPEAALEQKTAP